MSLPQFPCTEPSADRLPVEEVERESLRLHEELSAFTRVGPWKPSPVEEAGRLIREALIRTPGFLRRFRRTFLAAGRQNFPDSPLEKELYLEWGDRLPGFGNRMRGWGVLIRQMLRLRRHHRFRLADLKDDMIGMPSSYRIPPYHITEARLRHFYYRSQIARHLAPLGTVLEIGGGFGGLAAEIVEHLKPPVYYLVELPDAIPLAYYYLSLRLGCHIQALFRLRDKIDSAARVVLATPWKMTDLPRGVDLAVNTMSFQHMDSANLEFYFGQIGRLGTRRMYLVNRNRRRDPSDVPIDEYPIPPGMRLERDQKWPLGDHRERFYREAETGPCGA